jgi:hypothetical protein
MNRFIVLWSHIPWTNSSRWAWWLASTQEHKNQLWTLELPRRTMQLIFRNWRGDWSWAWRHSEDSSPRANSLSLAVIGALGARFMFSSISSQISSCRLHLLQHDTADLNETVGTIRKKQHIWWNTSSQSSIPTSFTMTTDEYIDTRTSELLSLIKKSTTISLCIQKLLNVLDQFKMLITESANLSDSYECTKSLAQIRWIWRPSSQREPTFITSTCTW